ncbi:MAG: TonB protein [Pseudomonas sp.]|nr:TonB protein [Pseudomonas sp.]
MKLAMVALATLWPIVVLAHDIELVPTFKPDPVYPEALKDAGVEGLAKVYFIVMANGLVKTAEIYETSHTEFAESAVQTVASWRFEPWSTEGGNPAEIEAMAPVLFYFGKK